MQALGYNVKVLTPEGSRNAADSAAPECYPLLRGDPQFS